jgi:GcrA cell cycle regulator
MTPSSHWFAWTPDTEQRLRDLAATDISARQIADEMGATSRNAIIGKAHRLGVKIRGSARRSAALPKPVACPVERRAAPKRPQEARKMMVVPSPVPPPVCDPVRLVDIRAHQCRWPLGDPKEEAFRFCGAPAERSFCPHHHALAYRPVERKREAA